MSNNRKELKYDLITTYEELLDYFSMANLSEDAMKKMKVNDFKIYKYSGIEEDEREIEIFDEPEDYTLFDFYEFVKERIGYEVDSDIIEYNDEEFSIFVNYEYRLTDLENEESYKDDIKDKNLCRGIYER